jgi:hypothetical protein
VLYVLHHMGFGGCRRVGSAQFCVRGPSVYRHIERGDNAMYKLMTRGNNV